MTDVSDAAKEDYAGFTLSEMEERNEERRATLLLQGVNVTPGLTYVESMLEVLLGDRLDEARASYQRKVGTQLDTIEAQLLRMRLGIAPER